MSPVMGILEQFQKCCHTREEFFYMQSWILLNYIINVTDLANRLLHRLKEESIGF